MPAAAVEDTVQGSSPPLAIEQVMRDYGDREIDIYKLLSKDPRAVITDDQAYNEYFVIRRFLVPQNK